MYLPFKTSFLCVRPQSTQRSVIVSSQLFTTVFNHSEPRSAVAALKYKEQGILTNLTDGRSSTGVQQINHTTVIPLIISNTGVTCQTCNVRGVYHVSRLCRAMLTIKSKPQHVLPIPHSFLKEKENIYFSTSLLFLPHYTRSS